MKFIIPWPPYSGNNSKGYNPRAKGRKVFTKPEMRKWAQNILLISHAPSSKIDSASTIRLYCRFFKPDKRKRDTDNVMKPVRDVLSKILGVDDENFMIYEESKTIDRENPRIEIDIEILNISS